MMPCQDILALLYERRSDMPETYGLLHGKELKMWLFINNYEVHMFDTTDTDATQRLITVTRAGSPRLSSGGS